MRSFLHRLLFASQWGASLVIISGCGSDVSREPGSTDGANGNENLNLDLTPEPVCRGPYYDDGGGFFGQCCDDVLCTTPVNGACPSTADARAVLTGLPPGSGSCECEPLRGPYANTDADSADACCYLVGSIGCEGRPLLVHGEARLAEVIAGPSAWSILGERRIDREPADRDMTGALKELDVSGLSAEARSSLAKRWAERGRNEHASVASFSRFSMGLIALGAPPELLMAAHRAALDEVRHARLAMSLASIYAGEPMGFGPLQVNGAFEEMGSLEATTLATVIEGCVGETLAALEVAAAAAQAGPPAVRAALNEIAEDEARHAELSWAFVRWAVGIGGSTLRAQVAATFEMALQRAGEPAGANAGANADAEELFAAHGFLPAEETARLRRQAIAEVIRPAASALIAGAAINAPSGKRAPCLPAAGFSDS